MEEEVFMMLGYGDDSDILVLVIFMFVLGMFIVVNRNMYLGLKLVNGVSYIVVEVIFDKVYFGYWISREMILYFGLFVGIVLVLEMIRDFCFVGMLVGIIFLMFMIIKIDC